MMIIPFSDREQDTVLVKTKNSNVSFQGKQDSTSHHSDTAGKVFISRPQVIPPVNLLPENIDTTSVCSGNHIASVTFTDSTNIAFRIREDSCRTFPFSMLDKIIKKEAEEKILLVKNLRQGEQLPQHPLQADWIIIIIIAALFMYSIVKTKAKSLFPEFSKYFSFKGINDQLKRDRVGLFHWQSTILNLVSFFIIGLFSYLAASYYDIIPDGFKGLTAWGIAFGIISLAVAMRHIVCAITGAISGTQEIFAKYLNDIYKAYRYSAFFMLILVVLISYTIILPVQDCLISGIVIAGLMYLIRILRLFVIFLNRNISIFYLILYLCALEILPVLILIRYITGLG